MEKPAYLGLYGPDRDLIGILACQVLGGDPYACAYTGSTSVHDATGFIARTQWEAFPPNAGAKAFTVVFSGLPIPSELEGLVTIRRMLPNDAELMIAVKGTTVYDTGKLVW